MLQSSFGRVPAKILKTRFRLRMWPRPRRFWSPDLAHSFLRCHRELRSQALSSWLNGCGRGAGVCCFTAVLHVVASEHRLSSTLSMWPWNQHSQCAREGKRSWACSRAPALCPLHPQPCSGSLFSANLVQTLAFTVRVSLLLCCQWRFTCLHNCLPLLSFCKRRLGIMTQENTPKATAPSSSFSLNIQRSWKGRSLRFTRQSSGACPSVQVRPGHRLPHSPCPQCRLR